MQTPVTTITQTQVQNPALVLVELHEVLKGLPLKPVQVLLDGTSLLECVSHTTQLGVMSKISEGALEHWLKEKLHLHSNLDEAIFYIKISALKIKKD